MTVIVFSWILFLTIFTIYESGSLYNDVFYMIKREKHQQDNQDQDHSPIIFAYTAVIAAIVLPHMNQID
jgi:hypothetical protein